MTKISDECDTYLIS